MAGPSEGARNRVAARAAAANGSSDAPQGNNSRSLVALLEDMRPHLERVAAHHLNPGRMLQLATTLLKTTPDLAKCTPFTFLGAVMQCAQVGLEPGVLGRAYIIPFFNRKKGVMEAQFVIGYRGIIELARRSGELSSIVARPVAKEDTFEFEYGLEERLVHKPPLDRDRGAAYCYYGVAHFKDGGHVVHVMSRADVERYRARSRASGNGPWVTDYDPMACKTVIRRMEPYLPLTAEAHEAVMRDEHILETSPDMGDIVDVTPEPEEEPEAGAQASLADGPAGGADA